MAETETTEVPQKAELWATVAGEKLQLIIPGMGWSFAEARAAKDISRGMAPVEIESRLFVTDSDAWMAVLLVSFMRAGKDFPRSEIENEDVIVLGEIITEKVLEELQKLPPTSPSSSGSDDAAEKLGPEENADQS